MKRKVEPFIRYTGNRGPLPPKWDEQMMLTNPEKGLLAGILIMWGKPGRNIKERLMNYFDSRKEAENRAYVRDIFKRAVRIKQEFFPNK